MIFKSIAFVFNLINAILGGSDFSRKVEKSGIFFTFLQPTNPGFLFQMDFFTLKQVLERTSSEAKSNLGGFQGV